MKEHIRFVAIISTAIICMILGCILFLGKASPTSGSYSAPLVVIDQNEEYPVTDVIDGDTFKASVASRIITVRLLGMDTPETVDPRKPVQCYGKEASDETKRLLDGRKVSLKQNPNREVRDKYGRYLAYVYRDDGLFVNEHLIQNGFAREYTYGSAYSLQKEFLNDQAVAQKEGKGLWSECK